MMLPGLAIVTEGISQLIGVVAGMLRALGTVPGFGWATEAANQLDTVKDGAHAVAQAIEGVVTQKDVSINTNAPQATQRIQTTRAALVSIPASVQSQISTPGATWSKQAIDDLRAAIGRLPASSQTSFRALLDRGQYSAAANELSRLAQPRTVTLRVQVSGGTAIYRYGNAQAFQADGGVRFFAGGGGFGRENHVAQIARPGEWRIWAEDETGASRTSRWPGRSAHGRCGSGRRPVVSSASVASTTAQWWVAVAAVRSTAGPLMRSRPRSSVAWPGRRWSSSWTAR